MPTFRPIPRRVGLMALDGEEPDLATEPDPTKKEKRLSAYRTRWFVTTFDSPRIRRPADVITVVAGALLILLGILGANKVSGLEDSVTSLLSSLPNWSRSLFKLAYAIGALYALLLVAIALLNRRARQAVLRDLLAVLVLAALMAVLLARWVEGEWPNLFPEFSSTDPITQFPVFRVVMVTAILATAAPHLIRPLRRLGWAVIALVTISGIGLGYGYTSDAMGANGLGLAAAGTVLLVFGSPRGYPDKEEIAAALRGLGVATNGLRIAPNQDWGARLLLADGPDGQPLAIKAYGRDATDSQLFAKLWRSIWFRDTGPALSYSRLHGVEHEALITLLAARQGVSTAQLIAAGEPGEDVALLVVAQPGRPIFDLGAEGISDRALASVWADVAKLHEASMAHGRLSASNVHLNRDEHVLTDFSAGSFGAPDIRIQSDVAELLFSLATVVGIERATRSALIGLGQDKLTAALPYLQLPSVSTRSRNAADDPKQLITDLQQEAGRLTNTDLPEPAQVRRVSTRQIVMTVLTLVAAYALISMLAGLDWVAVWNEIQDARWGWVVVALIVGQAAFVFEATAMMAAVGDPLPFRPVLVLQLASKYIGLAIPGVAGRVATNTAFLRKFGVSPAIAVTQGALDSLSGFIVEAAILVLVLLFGELTIGVDSGDQDWGLVMAIVLLVIIGGVLLVWRVQKFHDRVVPVLKQVGGALRSLFESPRRAFRLLGSNVASRLILAITLSLILIALDSPIGVATALVVVVATNLLAGLAPVPGGIGVAEAVLTAGLVAVGVDDNTAFAAAVVYRIITFYLPSVAGWYAVKWEEARGYL
ncbi:MAG: lysylphosphatidylglycerol synthase domain-containing protein [Acidimicrobiia bacterium]